MIAVVFHVQINMVETLKKLHEPLMRQLIYDATY